ncbi:restriction endonuclease, SacI family [Paenibacillus wenxiniae]|uniref:Restriction endonuclease, SacI family n=1 Tax=Paenibacillus wenxiniae TaxID=1636843 RepID=A0ABW4RF80_9BACL
MNFQTAEKLLLQSYNEAQEITFDPDDALSKAINTVLHGTHKTYKYIMVNAFLAKATDPSINPICLQKKSKLPGAYDARSLCHQVLIKFEREFLQNALGGSNEPFLNKPARFEELSLTNAVRSGKDKETLQLLCMLLPQITDYGTAMTALISSMYYLQKIAKKNSGIATISSLKNPTYLEINSLLNDLVAKSMGGEALALAIGALLNMYSFSLKGDTKVETHVVNQAGSSSKEVGDIDFYNDNILTYVIEAKDKIFTPTDVDHAIQKTFQSNCNRLTFIYGPHATKLGDKNEEILIQQAAQKGIFLNIISFDDFKINLLSMILPVTTDLFFTSAREVIREARMREETLEQFLFICKKYDLV